MASIKMKEDYEFDGKKIFKHVADYLPTYARPRFLRIQVNPLVVKFSHPLSRRPLSLRQQLPFCHGGHIGQIFTTLSTKLNKETEMSEKHY